MKRIRIVFLAILILFSMSDNLKVCAEEAGGRVLFISSYSYAWDTVQIQIDGIQAGLDSQVVLDYEFMDTKRVSDEAAMELFYEGLKYRLQKVAPYDVVILGDDAALLFALEHREELFSDIPLVFEGVNDEELAREASEDPFITGVLEKLSIEKNIDLGLKLNPEAHKVVAILDDSITGEAERQRFYGMAEKYPELEFSEINTSQLSTSALKAELSRVSKQSILIYVVMTEDGSGRQYTNLESVKMIKEFASVPAIRMVEGGIGEGLLGGNIVSMYNSGKIAAEIAMDIIGGKDCAEIEMIVDGPNIYNVDEQVMKKFGLDMSLLPEDTVIVNHEESFWERHKEAVIPSAILVGVLLVIIAWVIFDNIRRRKLMQELEKARGIMEAASQHDFLTGIPNRSRFMEDLQKAMAQNIPCTIMMIDIDDFKKINDTYGHTAGDDALKQISKRLQDMQSQILTPYRFAGDEFILLLKSNQGKIVEKTAFACRQVFTKPCVLCGEKRAVYGSIGIASFPKDAETVEKLIVCADDAMYQVKKSGKNDFAFYKKDEAAL